MNITAADITQSYLESIDWTYHIAMAMKGENTQ